MKKTSNKKKRTAALPARVLARVAVAAPGRPWPVCLCGMVEVEVEVEREREKEGKRGIKGLGKKEEGD